MNRYRMLKLRVKTWWLRSTWRRLWLAHTWPVRRRWGWLECHLLNFHEWEDAPALDAKGNFVLSKPGRWRMCKRPDCRIFRGKPALVATPKWLESDDFIVIARRDCGRCYGRGYTGLMILSAGVKSKVPCNCLRIQPAYIEHYRLTEKEKKRAEEGKQRAADDKAPAVPGASPEQAAQRA